MKAALSISFVRLKSFGKGFRSIPFPGIVGLQLQNRSQGIVHFLHSRKRKVTQFADNAVVIDHSNLFRQNDGILGQAPFGKRHENMAGQQFL